jgi:hypothetical protein
MDINATSSPSPVTGDAAAGPTAAEQTTRQDPQPTATDAGAAEMDTDISPCFGGREKSQRTKKLSTKAQKIAHVAKQEAAALLADGLDGSAGEGSEGNAHRAPKRWKRE